MTSRDLNDVLREEGQEAKERAFDANRTAYNGEASDEDPDLARLNKEFAVVRVGGRTKVMSFEESPARRGALVPVYSSLADFKNFHNKHRKEVTKPGGGTEKVGLGKWWVEHEERRQYDGVVYEPGNVATAGKLNLWRGFGVKPKAGNCSLYLAHVESNVCAGNSVHSAYLLDWMAQGVQRPGDRAETAIVLRGGEGVGKGISVKFYAELFGAHFVHVSQAGHLTGHFNAHLQQCSVLFADEALFAGDRKHEGILKALITEDTLMIEPKGVDSFAVRNCLHIIMSSNSDWVIPAGADARRFCVLDVADKHKQDTTYFGAIAKQMDSGGREALLHFLLNRNLADFNIRAVPMTEALADQKAHSRRGIDLLVETLAKEGNLPSVRAGFPNMTVTSGEARGEGFYVKARALVPGLRHMSSMVIARSLKQWGCEHWHSMNIGGISFPPLPELRERFDKKHGPQEWSEPHEWE